MITPAFSPTATERVLPRMALDFTTGVLDSRVTVARALNTATRTNSSGLVEGVNANLPRFDYDPVTLAPKGLLIEEARTNLVTNSTGFGANWSSGANSTVTANGGSAPDGTTSATRITLVSGVSNNRYINVPVTVTPGSAYTFSVFLKTVSGALFQAVILFGPTGSARAWLNTSTGAISGLTSVNYTGASMVATNFGNGWWRVALTATVVTDTTVQVDAEQASASGNYNAAPGDSYLIYGAQLEAGAFATSYIPTTTLAVLRNADAVSMTGTNFSDWYNSTQGTFSAQYSVGTISTFVFSAVNSATPTTEVMYLRYVGNQHQGITVTGGATVSTIFDGTGLNAVNNVKTAFAYKASAYGIRTNGGSLAGVNSNTTSGALPSGINKLVIGANQTGTGAFINGCIAKLSYYNISLLNAELSAVSK